jgi:hypothetical protein
MAHLRRKITKAAIESPIRFSVTSTAKICPIEMAANILRFRHQDTTNSQAAQSFALPAFFALAHRSFINFAIFALAAGLMVRFRTDLAAFPEVLSCLQRRLEFWLIPGLFNESPLP